MTSLRILFLTLFMFQDVLGDQFKVETPGTITAIEGSCLVVPCSFRYPGALLKAVMWLKGDKTNGVLVLDSTTNPDPAFEGRTNFLDNWKTNKDCTLKINNLGKNDVGKYYFRMEQNNSMNYSDPDGVTIDLSGAPSLLNITSSEMIEGTEVSLTCSVKYLCAGPLRWYSAEGLNRSTSTGTEGTARNGWVTSSTLRFVPSYKDHGRTLSCGLHSVEGGSHRKNITLNVNYAPKDVYIASSRFTPISRGVPITLRCMVSTSNPPVTSYKWSTKHGHRFGETLTIGAAVDDSDYTCEAENSLGKVSSDKVSLVILKDNQWGVWAPLSMAAREGSCVRIPCRCRYHDRLKNQIWLKGHHFHGAVVYHSNGEINANYTGRIEFDGSVEAKTCTLKIKNLTAADSGKYYFRMETDKDKWSGRTPVNLLVSEKPEKPEIEIPKSIVEGESTTVICSVKTFCREDVPGLMWYDPYPSSSTSSETRMDNRDNMWIYSRSLTFVPTYEERERTLKCTVRFAGKPASAESEIKLNVKYRPRYINISMMVNGKTEGHALKESDAVTLSCIAHRSHPTVSEYTWYKNGTPVGRSHLETLQFSSIAYTDYGTYCCQANNEVGSSRSEDITVRGKYRPRDFHISYSVNGENIEHPSDIKEGDRLNVSCVSTDSDPTVSEYIWYKSRTTRVGQTFLQFVSVTKEDNGAYHCEGSNEVGTGNSPTIDIEVLYPPSDVNVVAFESAIDGRWITLRCQSDAKPMARWYSWRKVCKGTSSDLARHTYQFTFQVSVSDASCDFYCTATNIIGEKQSGSKRLNVQYKPRNVKITSSGQEREGSSVRLRCESDANPRANVYTWTKRCNRVHSDLQRNQYLITIIITSDDAFCDYYCTAGNTVGKENSPTKHINVQYSPKDIKVTGSSPTGEVMEGDKVVLSCSSRGNPVPQYYWYKDGVNAGPMKENRPELIFNVIRWDDSGTYYCKVTNEMGSVRSQPFLIDVFYGPRYTKISVSSPTEVITEGDNVTLTCSSDSNPPADRYQWFKSRGDSRINLERPSKELAFYRITWEQEGLYFCEAGNRVRTERSEGQRIDVLSRHIKLIIITVAVLLAVFTVVILVCLILRRKKIKTDSLSQPDTDINGTVYSVIMKRNKSKETTVYENMVMTEGMASNCNQSPLEHEGCIEYALINFTPGSRDIGGHHQKKTARPTGKESSKVNVGADPAVIYGLVHKAYPPSKHQASDDYENVGHLYPNEDDASEDEINYTSVVHLNQPRNLLKRQESDESIDYTAIRF